MANGAYNVHYWVKDIPSLIFWFRAIAGGNEAPDGFTIDRDWQPVDRIIARHSTTNGVLANEHRTLLIARKGEARGMSASRRGARRASTVFRWMGRRMRCPVPGRANQAGDSDMTNH